MIEVEVKARAAPGTLKKVKALGARFLEAEHHQDLDFNAPDRDFRRTDEALRIRIMEANLTYKGRKLDTSTKSRLELKTDIHDPEALKQILVALGFTPSGEVRKTRTKYVLGELIFALDEVEGLGVFPGDRGLSPGWMGVQEGSDSQGSPGHGPRRAHKKILRRAIG